MNTHPCPRTLPQGTGGRETLASITASWRIGSAASPRSVGSPARKGNCSASPGAMMPERMTLAAVLRHRDRRGWTLRALLALATLISVGGNAALGGDQFGEAAKRCSPAETLFNRNPLPATGQSPKQPRLRRR